MNERLIIIKDELEWLHVKQTLEDHDIPFRLVEKKDTVFPGLQDSTRIELIIQEDRYENYIDLVGNSYETKLIENRTVRKSSIFSIKSFLILYSIGMTLLFARMAYINHQNNTDPNFDYSWSYDSRSLSLKHKITGDINTIYTDGNFDGNFELIEVFSKGNKIATFFDNDEDGIIEKQHFFDINGRYIGYTEDWNKDGLADSTMMFIESGDTLIFKDINKNGLPELKRRNTQ